MFYDLFCELCARKGIAPTRAALDMGMSKATPTTWKKQRDNATSRSAAKNRRLLWCIGGLSVGEHQTKRKAPRQ